VAPAAQPPYYSNAPPELAAAPALQPLHGALYYAAYFGAHGGNAQEGAPRYMPPPPSGVTYGGITAPPTYGGGAEAGAPRFYPPPPSGVSYYGGMAVPGTTYGGPPSVTYNV
jgi:hypothetical protein